MFSEKYGYSTKLQIQYECISEKLRQRIWNLFYQEEILDGGLSSKRISQTLNGEQTIESKIADILGLSISNTKKGLTLQEQIELYLLKTCKWFEVYDFLEIYLQCITGEERKKRQRQYNDLLEYEKSGYRIVDGIISPITNSVEISAIENAMETDHAVVNQHFHKALLLYSDFEKPDYENSIKESISAVEAICCTITGISGSGSSLGKTIKKLKDNGIHIHKSMENAFSSLYGYTSDEDGIRHGGIDFINAPSEDAKYMLISCAAFVSYLIEKQSKMDCYVCETFHAEEINIL